MDDEKVKIKKKDKEKEDDKENTLILPSAPLLGICSLNPYQKRFEA